MTLYRRVRLTDDAPDRPVPVRTGRRTAAGTPPTVAARLGLASDRRWRRRVPIGVYLWIALHRVGYRYELDWMEGGSVELAARVAAGHSLYVAPSLSFVGWTYPPLYYCSRAGVAQARSGSGFLPAAPRLAPRFAGCRW